MPATSPGSTSNRLKTDRGKLTKKLQQTRDDIFNKMQWQLFTPVSHFSIANNEM
jgi:hypothetical protein